MPETPFMTSTDIYGDNLAPCGYVVTLTYNGANLYGLFDFFTNKSASKNAFIAPIVIFINIIIFMSLM
jgi:hypothetical protein